MRIITHSATPADRTHLRFPKGGVWSLQHPAGGAGLDASNAYATPMPGDLTTDQVLDNAQHNLDMLVTEVNEIRDLIDDVVFRFPSRPSDGDDWSPSAA